MATKRECIRAAMDTMGWKGQIIANPHGHRLEEPSSGCPAQDLQSAFDWNRSNHGNFNHWRQIFDALLEFSENHIEMEKFVKEKDPGTYNSMCIFRVIGFVEEDSDGELFPKHFIGTKRGDNWLWKDGSGKLNPFNKEPIVDSWAYLT